MIWGGVPRQDLSRAQGAAQKNLHGDESSFFFEALRVIRTFRFAAKGSLKVFFVVENVMMDAKPKSIVSEELGCRPITIPAGPV